MYDGSVANAKELDSIRHEVENLKKRRTDREDELLGLMEMREELEGQETRPPTSSHRPSGLGSRRSGASRPRSSSSSRPS